MSADLPMPGSPLITNERLIDSPESTLTRHASTLSSNHCRPTNPSSLLRVLRSNDSGGSHALASFVFIFSFISLTSSLMSSAFSLISLTPSLMSSAFSSSFLMRSVFSSSSACRSVADSFSTSSPCAEIPTNFSITFRFSNPLAAATHTTRIRASRRSVSSFKVCDSTPVTPLAFATRSASSASSTNASRFFADLRAAFTKDESNFAPIFTNGTVSNTSSTPSRVCTAASRAKLTLSRRPSDASASAPRAAVTSFASSAPCSTASAASIALCPRASRTADCPRSVSTASSTSSACASGRPRSRVSASSEI
mmetsp:Transcript_34032/g.73383  ORF Transcript_34032/g.73383 Transcript_34032/m.73383 type:complete len:310 (+) Transcript_34032:689-1618(+)